MTAQIPDTFLYQGEEYSLVALEGERLITPQDYQMQPAMLHTACYRGFYSTYEITDDGLFLTEMVIGEVKEGYKPIQGILPTLPQEDCYGYPTYKGLRLLAPFSGKIRLAKDFIKELYVHIGYQKATAYKTLLEFTFEAGKLVTMQDISAENAKKRGAFKKRFETGNLIQSIEESFSLDFEIE
ncbi:MAG: hypothetical protein SAK29_14795 [Scytonema sp. PMC 1069.18]|nr:hypothetical protein [Scytonema sp. PMC 1069.18]MEC4886862.1 hypothetical protein [Scytonema sp. PMC 1070.18]